MVNVNSIIPSFSLLDDNGNKFTQENLKNHLTVIYFYPKDNTPGCTNEAIDFNNLIEKFSQYNTQIIGISKDTIESHQKFKEKYNLKFSLLSDPSLNIHKQFGAYGLKVSFGKSYEGVIRSTFIISSELKVLYKQAKVTVKGHADFILSKVKTLSSQTKI